MNRKSNGTHQWVWTVVVLLWPVALLNYLDRQMLAAMKTSMVVDIVGLQSDAQWGFVLGSFKWIYALLSPFAGFIGDRTSRRHVIGLSNFPSQFRRDRRCVSC